MPTFDCGISGLVGTVGCTILTSAGVEHVARTTAGISEPIAGSGVYYIAEHDAALTLIYVWDIGAGDIGASDTLYSGGGGGGATLEDIEGSTVLAKETTVAALDPLIDAIKAKTDTLGAASITVSSPVAADGTTLTVYAGDSYPLVHGRSGISVDIADVAHAYELTAAGAVVKLKCFQATWTATTVTSTADGWTILWTPTAAQTALITVDQTYEVEVTHTETSPPNNVITLARGTLTCVRDIPAVSS